MKQLKILLNRKVLMFIRRFRCAATIRIFTQGGCYWFAHILAERFGGEIMYNDIDNHFVCLIAKRCYDITGPVANTRGYVPWSLYKKSEPLNSKRITTQCILIV